MLDVAKDVLSGDTSHTYKWGLTVRGCLGVDVCACVCVCVCVCVFVFVC